MLSQRNPGLRRFNVVVNSFTSCITDAAKEFSRTPEMPIPEIVSKPWMFLHQSKSTVTFEQLQSFADAHSGWEFNKQMDVVNSDVQLIDFAFLPVSNLPDEKFTVHSEPIKLEGVHCIFNFPDKMESILSEAMFSGFQIHFLSPKSAGDKAHANFDFSSEGLGSNPSSFKVHKELNLIGDGDSSPNLKVWVSSPWM
jgi:hypothetical protein